MTNSQSRTATLYRMVMPNHLCPYGLKSKDLLERHGYIVDDRHLTTREETDAFKEEHEVSTTPQIFVNGERVGGHDALRAYVGQKVPKSGDTTYRPVIALFSMAALMSLAACWLAFRTIPPIQAVEWFLAISMCLLALQKLKDIEGFSTMFLNYDLLARRWVRYGYVYPFAEAAAGILMLAGVLVWISAPIALFIGGIGAASVFKAVYIDKRELKCACVGGDTNVPLGAVSLTENLMMIAMGVWMPLKAWVV